MRSLTPELWPALEDLVGRNGACNGLRMSNSFLRTLIVVVALAHATFFIIYQSPDWPTEWTDQNGYTVLGRAIAQQGRFTRYPDYPQFVPEVIRTPGYPLFVAAVNRTIGQGQFPVAAAQAIVFAVICLLVSAIVRLFASERVALAAGFATALFPPLPYYSALTLTELFTTFLVTLGIYLWLRALRGGTAWAVGSGVIVGLAALTRPTFQYLLIALGFVACLRRDHTARRATALSLLAFAATLAPWLLYNWLFFRMLTFTPAGGIGRGIWEGSWQGVFPGRVQAELTSIAAATWQPSELDTKVHDCANRQNMNAEPMLRYVHQWQEVRQLWDTPKEPWPRAVARIAADRRYGQLGMENIRRDPVGHAWRRMTRGVALLWITEIPVRYSDINSLSPLTIRLIWIVQALLLIGAAVGLAMLWHQGYKVDSSVFAAVILYVTAVHAALYSEARYALPARPVVLLLAIVAMARGMRHVNDWLTGAKTASLGLRLT